MLLESRRLDPFDKRTLEFVYSVTIYDEFPLGQSGYGALQNHPRDMQHNIENLKSNQVTRRLSKPHKRDKIDTLPWDELFHPFKSS